MELAQVGTAVAIGFGLWNLIRVEQVRRAGTDEGLRNKQIQDVEALYKKIDVEGSILREKLEIEHLKVSILEARLKPLLDSFDKRLAEMFHQPHPSAARLDRLIEEYRRSADIMPPPRLQEIIDQMVIIKDQASKNGAEPDPFVFLIANLWLGFLDGRRDAWRLMLRHEARLRELEARQMMLEDERQQLDMTRPAEAADMEQRLGWRQWWIRLKKFLGGCK